MSKGKCGIGRDSLCCKMSVIRLIGTKQLSEVIACNKGKRKSIHHNPYNFFMCIHTKSNHTKGLPHAKTNPRNNTTIETRDAIILIDPFGCCDNGHLFWTTSCLDLTLPFHVKSI